MKFKDLKRYVLLSSGNQIDQKYETITEDDVIQEDNNLYIKLDDEMIVDGKLLKFKNRARVVFTCQTDKCLIKHIKQLREYAEIYFDALAQCMCRINAYCEYHLYAQEKLYKDAGKELPESIKSHYRGLHLGLEDLKRNMNYQILWNNLNIEYFGQGGNLKKQKWYDTPLGTHKDAIYW